VLGFSRSSKPEREAKSSGFIRDFDARKIERPNGGELPLEEDVPLADAAFTLQRGGQRRKRLKALGVQRDERAGSEGGDFV
jgi:hypothetical protein